MAVPTERYSNGGSGAGSLTILGAGEWKDDDVVFVFVATETGQALPTTTGATPKNIAAADSGWTQMAGSPQTVTGGSRLYGFWRRVKAGDAAPQTGDSGEYQAYVVIGVVGAIATGTPYEALAFGTEATSDTSLSIPSITTVGVDRLILGACSTGADSASSQFGSWTNANLSGKFEEFGDVCTTAGVGGGVAGYLGGKPAAGATGATTATLATASPKAFLHLAVVPPAGATVVAVGQAVETDTAQSVQRRHTRTLTQVAETSSAQLVRATRQIAVAQVSEVDVVIGALLSSKRRTLGIPVEVDTVSGALGRRHTRALLQAFEIGEARALTPAKAQLLGRVIEVNTAQLLGRSKIRQLLQVQELDVAGALLALRSVGLQRVVEVDFAQAMLLPIPRLRPPFGAICFGEDLTSAIELLGDRGVTSFVDALTAAIEMPARLRLAQDFVDDRGAASFGEEETAGSEIPARLRGAREV